MPRRIQKRQNTLLRRKQIIDALRKLIIEYGSENVTVRRIAKEIGSSLEAKVTLIASGKTLQLLRQYSSDLRYVFIVSQVEVIESTDTDTAIQISQAEGQKCERCWNYSSRVGESTKYPTVCERCVTALDEIERGAQSV